MKKYYLASPMKRLYARIIDFCIYILIYKIIAYFVMSNSSITLLLLKKQLFITILSISIFFLLNYNFLASSGQSAGKKLLGIQIFSMKSKLPSVWTTFCVRELFLVFSFDALLILSRLYIPFLEPYAGVLFLLNFLFIFRPDRRCIHDFLAGTQVIDSRIPPDIININSSMKKTPTISSPISEQESSTCKTVSDDNVQENTAPFLLYKPATRTDRFLGYLIDKIAIFTGYVLIVRLISISNVNIESINGYFLMFIECLVSFLIINSYPLITNQQTLGKVLLSTKIVGANDGGKVSFFKILFYRELLFWILFFFGFSNPFLDFPLISVLSILSLLVNASFIYRDDRRCLHDWSSQTRVVYLNLSN